MTAPAPSHTHIDLNGDMFLLTGPVRQSRSRPNVAISRRYGLPPGPADCETLWGAFRR
jgi:hypothetical protein